MIFVQRHVISIYRVLCVRVCEDFEIVKFDLTLILYNMKILEIRDNYAIRRKDQRPRLISVLPMFLVLRQIFSCAAVLLCITRLNICIKCIKFLSSLLTVIE